MYQGLHLWRVTCFNIDKPKAAAGFADLRLECRDFGAQCVPLGNHFSDQLGPTDQQCEPAHIPRVKRMALRRHQPALAELEG